MGVYSYFKIGDVVNNWTIISECFKAKSGKDCYRCRCTCGNESNVEGRALAQVISKSCGCTRIVDPLIKKRRQQKYKQQWYQDNKEKIRPRILESQKQRRKEFKEKYGADIYSISSRYGISPDEYLELIESQDNKCAICGCDFSVEQNLQKACVDHDHNTGAIRGLLCRACNMAIGLFNDNPDTCLNACMYLKEHKDEKTCYNS